jgi:Bacterial Ig-like domain
MNRNFWQCLTLFFPLAALMLAVSCTNTPPLKATQTRALEGAPTIVSIDPPDGAAGVKKDTNVVVTFSQPMNTLETQAAYSSGNLELDAANVTFTWNADQTVLTIDPNTDLTYNTGTDPSAVTANQYGFAISELATDANGNALTSASSSFTTFKFIHASMKWITSLSKDSKNGFPLLYGGDIGDSLPYLHQDDPLNDPNFREVPNLPSRDWTQFDLITLPASLESKNVLSATLSMYKWDTRGSPYTNLGLPCNRPRPLRCPPTTGSVQVESVALKRLQHIAASAPLSEVFDFFSKIPFDGRVLRNLGDLDIPIFNWRRGLYETTTPDGWKTINVLEAIQDDLKLATQVPDDPQLFYVHDPVVTFRLRFQRETNFDNLQDSVGFWNYYSPTTKPKLEVDYLIP